MKWRLLRSFRPEGHAYFEDEKGNVAVADCSGTTPDTTDEGPLYVDFNRELICRDISVPLKGGTSTPASDEEARWVKKRFKFGDKE